MAGFSIDTALKSGFGLARRQPLAVLVWGVVYALVGLLTEAIAAGPALPEYLRRLQDDPDGAALFLEKAAEANGLIALGPMLLVSAMAAALVHGAVARALLHPEERGFFFMRLSRRELWLGLTVLVLAMAMVAIAFAAGMVVILISMAGALWGVLAGVILAIGVLYLAVRFSTAWVQAFDERRLVLRDAWRLTKGQGWRLVLLVLALLFLILILSAVVLIPAGVMAMVLFGVAGVAGGSASTLVGVVTLLVLLVLASGFYGLILTLSIAAMVEVYRALSATRLPGGEAAEVLA